MNVAKMLGVRKCIPGIKVKIIGKKFGDEEQVEYGVLERNRSYYWRVRTINGRSLNPRYWERMERISDVEYNKQRLLAEV